MLDDAKHFLLFLQNYGADLFKPPVGGTSCGADHEYYRLYCPKCGGARRMDVQAYWWTGGEIRIGNDSTGRLYWSACNRPPEDAASVSAYAVPSVYGIRCRDCDTRFTALLYPGPDGHDLVVLPERCGGLRTTNTPPGVAFYLDQAYRARSVGAKSAAMAMFRAAVEHLLFEQGYKQPMLGSKLRALDDDIKAASAPKWALELDTAFLTALKELGDGAIHPNDGDVDKQKAIDNELIGQVQTSIAHLLFLVYELPHQKQAALSELQSRAAILKK